MSTIVLSMIPDNWDDNEDLEWESSVASFSVPALAPPAPIEKPTISIPVIPSLSTETKLKVKNIYTNYPYFLAGVEGTVQKDLFPRSEFPLKNIKQSLTTPAGLNNYAHSVRNYINSLFYVLKSTKYYNPVTKMRVPPKKTDRIDPNFQYVSLNDQLKVYRLFGFQGHLGSKKDDEDIKRDELLEKLKNILYNTNTLIVFIELLLIRLFVTVSQDDIRMACEGIKARSDYDQKSYHLSANWFHDASWQKLRYVYGANILDNLGEGDGAIPRELVSSILKASTFKK